MNKYGQAEYAYGILQQISEKLLAEGVLTEEQLKQLNALNKEGCFSSVLHSFGGVISLDLVIPFFRKKWYCVCSVKIRLEGAK